MNTRPSESVFGIPARFSDHSDSHAMSVPATVESVDAAEPAPEVEWANTELLSIATTIQELQDRLVQANVRLEKAAKVETTEVEIGRLFVEAQRFSEESLTKLELHVHEILCEAEAKAIQILTEATEEAQEIRREAQQAAFMATATARELQAAIAGFTTVNHELVKELGTLNAMLTPASEQGPVGPFGLTEGD
jgi:hypothetical protein